MSARRRPEPADANDLVAEVQRYLAAVDAFREAGCVVRWRPERQWAPAARVASERRN